MVPPMKWVPVAERDFYMKKNHALSFSIHLMQTGDLEEATRMRMQSWRDTYVNDELGITLEWIEKIIEDELASEKMDKRRERFVKGGSHGWVARDIRGKIIGVSMPFVMEDGTQRVGSLYVDKGWHGKGVDSALMEHVIKFHNPSQPIMLSVASYNQRAQAFYRKYGFDAIPNSEELFLGKIPTIRMIRKGNL